MAPRFPLSDIPDPSTATQVDDTLRQLHGENVPFEWKDSQGELLGPYAPLSYVVCYINFRGVSYMRIVIHPLYSQPSGTSPKPPTIRDH
jgi:hypothetical protein